MRRSAVLLLAVAAACSSPPRIRGFSRARAQPRQRWRTICVAISSPSRMTPCSVAAPRRRMRRALRGSLPRSCRRRASQPAGDSGGYLQRVPLSRTFVRSARFTVTSPPGARELPVRIAFSSGALARRRAAASGARGRGRSRVRGLRALGAGLRPQRSRGALARGQGGGVREQCAAGARLRAQGRAARSALARRSAGCDHRAPSRGDHRALHGAQADELPALAAGSRDSSLRLQPTLDGPRVLPMVLFGNARDAAALLPAGWPHNDRSRALDGRSFSGTSRSRAGRRRGVQRRRE